jgi:hypothetical protein|nr:MAG TPA: hypothetical protein [Caudoviricetes sp.]
MIIVLYNATQQGNNVFIKEWDYNYGIRGEAMNTFEELFKEYIGEDLKLIKMKQIIYNTYVIENMTINDLQAYSDKFKERATEIKKYKNDKRITKTRGDVSWFFKYDFDMDKILLPVDIDMLSL